MKREGVRRGIPSDGVVVSLVERADVCSDSEESMPERIAIPRVP